MTAVALFASHAGGHCKPPSPVTLFFRRMIAAVRRRKAVPAVAAAGAAEPSGWPCCVHCLTGSPCIPPDNHPIPCSDGCNGLPVLGDQMLSEVRAEQDKAYPRPTYYPRPDGDVIVDKRNHVHLRPVNGRNLGDLPRRTPAATLNRAPWETGAFPVPADVTLVPAYGQAPVARVLEAERLAGELIA